jgi:hypothetical protein
MSKGNTFENDLLKLILNAVPIANLADDAASSPLTSLHVALHTANPGEGGSQTTNECTYGDYDRVPVDRDAGSPFWSISGGIANPSAPIDFPEASSGSETATHFSIGTDPSGAGKILYSGAITPNLSISTGAVPRLTTATAISED